MSGFLGSIGGIATTVENAAFAIFGNSPVKLGTVAFDDMEVPESMPFGGKQNLSRKTLIGGKRKIQALGPDARDLTWSGRFKGITAQQRADAVDLMCQQGLPVSLVWGNKNLVVYVAEFNGNVTFGNQILYTITCHVVSSQPPAANFLTTPITSLVGADVSSALGLSSLLGNASIGSALQTAQGTLAALGPLTGISALGQAATVLGGVQSAATGLVGAASSISGVVLNGAAALGVTAPQIGATLTSAATGAASLANASSIASYAIRAGKNIAGAS